MSFEEIQRAIEQMLGIQRQLQEGQLRLQESQLRQREDIERMLGVQRELQEGQPQLQGSQLRQREEIDRLIRLVDRLIGYSITNEFEHLTLEECMDALDRRTRRLEL
ncbi:MAG: hypothetical protein HC833_21275 [Leptolyngbyaceae cyanobacterium RM1_406_9]|nr:hypothetical protein [Leptolyngbyaceae cyanobacterium RM1_406_9]